MTVRLLVVEDREAIAEGAAAFLGERMAAATAKGQSFSLALAGGTTPGPAYALLGTTPWLERVVWSRVTFYFGDERAVPPGDPESNYRLAHETLFSRLPPGSAAIHRMAADAPDLDAAARHYAALLPGRLDLIVLGLGADGHTASLFPGSAALDESDRSVVTVNAPKPPPRRLTITPPVIAAARELLVLAAGVDKAGALQRALYGDSTIRETPAQLARRGQWIVDRDAAGG